MIKKGACLFIILSLVLSLTAPAFVRAADTYPMGLTQQEYEQYRDEFMDLSEAQLKGLAAIANANCLDYTVTIPTTASSNPNIRSSNTKSSNTKSSNTKLGPAPTGGTIFDWLEYIGSETYAFVSDVAATAADVDVWAADQIRDILGINSTNTYLSSGVSANPDFKRHIRFDGSTVRSLTGNNFTQYGTFGSSISGSAFPSYVPDEYRAYLSYLNTWDDLNLDSHAIPSDQVLIVSTVVPDYSKFFFAPGSRYSWYYDDTMQPHGLLYYFNGWDDLYSYPTYRYNLNLPYSNPVYSFDTGTDSYGGRYPGFELYNDRVRILLNPSTNWGDDNEYTLNLIAYSGYNDDTYTIAPSSLALSQFTCPEYNYSYRYPGSDTIYDNGHGALGSIGISGYNYGLIYNRSGGSLPSPSVRVMKRSDDKLLDTIATLVEYMRNVDVYVGDSWDTATIWYQPDNSDPGVTFEPTNPIIPSGSTESTFIVHMPNSYKIDLFPVYVYLRTYNITGPIIIAPGDLPSESFPGEDGEPDGTTDQPVNCIDPYDPNYAIYPAYDPPQNEFPLWEHDDDGNPFNNGLFSTGVGNIVAQYYGITPTPSLSVRSLTKSGVGDYDPIGEGQGYYNVDLSLVDDEGVEQSDSATDVARDLLYAGSSFLGPLGQYIWYVVGMCAVVSLVLKILHS